MTFVAVKGMGGHRSHRDLFVACLLFALLFLTSFPAVCSAGDVSPPTAAAVDPLEIELARARSDLATKPSVSAHHIRIGYLLLKKGALAEALLSFDEALKLNPRSHEAKTGKGSVLLQKGELAEAEKLLREALLLNPDPVRTFYELGLLYEKQGQYARAVAEYREGLIKVRQGRK